MRTRLVPWLVLGLLLHLVAGAIAQQQPASPYQLAVVTDRPEALYTVGEAAKFLVTLKKDGQAVPDAEISYQLDKDGMPPMDQGALKLEGGSGTIEGKLGEPGFLLCRVSYKTEEGDVIRAVAGAGFDPLKIGPSMPVPDDFDAFWAGQKARLAAVPMEPKLTPVNSPQEGIEVFDVEIACVPPRPVRGYYARPAGAAPKSLPAILTVHGAGVRSSSLGGPAGLAKTYQAIAMDINAHGIPNGQTKEFYDALSAGELKGYPHFGREDRETSYFLGMFLRVQRALDFLTSQPEWDGQVLVVQGSSQGGGQSIAAAGLDPRVTLISAGVPAICDHTGKAVGRTNGWPRLADVAGKPDPKIMEVSRYFDCVNFATRAKAEAIFSVGFIDGTCAPTSVYAAYNAWPGKKQIINEPLMGHSVSRKLGEVTAARIRAQIDARK